jgi:hypothetical protein
VEKDEIRETIKRILKREIDDVDNALRKGDIKLAQSELGTAIKKLKRLMNAI